MADIRPLGSERLEGLDKIKRIMEIAKYKDASSNPVNENTSSEYNITFADGNSFGIVKEKQGYIIKQMLEEGQSDYIEPMKNRKFSSLAPLAFLVLQELFWIRFGKERGSCAEFVGGKRSKSPNMWRFRRCRSFGMPALGMPDLVEQSPTAY